MKKMISFILAAAMSAMVAVPAFAAAPEADTVRDGENVNTWTTSGQSDNFKDKMMTMIAYAPNGEGEITVDSIQYIDQTTADASGAYSFDSYIPKDLPTAGEYTVIVGSEVLDNAIDAGTIEKIEVTDVAVTGTITTQSKAAKATIDFCAAGTTTPVVSAETTDGAFTANVTPGTYDVIISRPGYLKYIITNVVVTEGFSLKPVTIQAGNVDTDDNVTVSDVGAVVSAYSLSSSDEGYQVEFDFNVDGNITVSDVGAVVANYGQGITTIDFADFNK